MVSSKRFSSVLEVVVGVDCYDSVIFGGSECNILWWHLLPKGLWYLDGESYLKLTYGVYD